MANKLIHLALLRSDLLVLIIILDFDISCPLEWFADISNAFYFDKKRLCEIPAFIEFCVQASCTEK